MSKILILDDDQQIIKMTSLLLAKHGHDILTSTNGTNAIETMTAERVDLLITDILMPEMDGLEVINACRKAGLPVKIIAMSGGRRKISAEFNLQSAEMLGASQVLPKPFSQQQLLSAVNTLL